MKIFIFFISIVFFWSCRPEPLTIDLPTYKERIVVSSQIVPTTTMVVGLTNSFTVLSQSSINGELDSTFFRSLLIDSALVTIKYGSNLDTLVKIAPGVFGSNTTPQNVKQEYQLYVYDYKTNQEVSASSIMLPQVKFDQVSATKDVVDGKTIVKLDYSFTDPTNEQNYYMINVFTQNSILDGLDVNSYFDRGENKLIKTIALSDFEFDEVKVKGKLLLDEIQVNDTLAVTLSNISKQYYGYLLQRERASEDILSQISNEPINYNTNVTNGLGFFNTHNPDIRLFFVSEL